MKEGLFECMGGFDVMEEGGESGFNLGADGEVGGILSEEMLHVVIVYQ